MSFVKLRAAGTPASWPGVDAVEVVLGCVEGVMSCNVHVGDADHSDLTSTPFLRNAVTKKCHVLRSLSHYFMLEQKEMLCSN